MVGRALVLRTTFVAGIGAVLAKVLISCVDLESLGNGPPDGAAPPAEASVPDVVDPCTHDQPAATSSLNDGDGELPTFVLALNTITFDPKKVVPLDLDGVCTCDPRPGTAREGGPACASPEPNCDADGGGDNSLGLVANESAPIVGVETVVNRVIAAGHRTLLLQIEKYNGLANDKEVVVGTLLAEGIRSQGCPSSVLEAAKPLWSTGGCGNDPWTVSPASVLFVTGSGLLPLARGIGYVRDFQLIVRIKDTALFPFNDESTFRVAMPIVQARLVPLDENLAPRDPARPPATEREKRLFRIDEGVIAGRVLTTDVLGILGAYQPSTGPRLCAQDAKFGLVRERICRGADIPAQGTAPFDPSKACDALSGALGFAAIPAVTAPVADAAVPNTGCESVDAAAFRCP